MYTEIKNAAGFSLNAVSGHPPGRTIAPLMTLQAVVTQCVQGMKVSGDKGMDQYLGNRESSLSR